MPFELRQTIDWLYQTGADKVLGPKAREHGWLYGDAPVPRGTYRSVLILLADPAGLGLLDGDLSQLPRGLERQARQAGFRLLQVIPQIRQPEVPGLEGVPTFLFSGYAASDALLGGTVSELGQALGGAVIVMSDQDVSLSERATLDARWVAAGAGEEFTADLEQTTIKHKIDVWPLVGGAVVLSAVVAGIWALTSGRNK